MTSHKISNRDFELQLRKSYIKPKIERVSLVPKETVLGGCKIPSISGPSDGVGGTGCTLGVPGTSCLENTPGEYS